MNSIGSNPSEIKIKCRNSNINPNSLKHPEAGEILKIYVKFSGKILKFRSDNILFTPRF